MNPKQLLITCTEKFPPKPNTRHSLTVDEEGQLILSMMLPLPETVPSSDNEFLSLILLDNDFDRSIEDLVAELESVVLLYQNDHQAYLNIVSVECLECEGVDACVCGDK